MRKYLAVVSVFFAIAVLSLSTGCNRRPEGLPALSPVTITVQCDGKPVPGVGILVTPTEDKFNFIFTATTDENGVAKPGTNHAGKIYSGVPQGKMAVSADKGITLGSGDEAHIVPMIASASPTELEVSASGAEMTIQIEAIEDYQDLIYEQKPQMDEE